MLQLLYFSQGINFHLFFSRKPIDNFLKVTMGADGQLFQTFTIAINSQLSGANSGCFDGPNQHTRYFLFEV
jgi:hypothetical protein